MTDLLESYDISLFLLLNGLHTEFLDTAMIWISDKYIWIPFYVILLVLIAVKHGWKGLALAAPALILLITLSDQLSVHLFKNVFERYRPCYNENIRQLVHLVGDCGGQYGFVSSHAANTFALATFIMLVMKTRSFCYLMLTWAVVVSYSRIYLGVHYPADVICGALFGCIAGAVIWHLTGRVNARLNYILSYE